MTPPSFFLQNPGLKFWERKSCLWIMPPASIWRAWSRAPIRQIISFGRRTTRLVDLAPSIQNFIHSKKIYQSVKYFGHRQSFHNAMYDKLFESVESWVSICKVVDIHGFWKLKGSVKAPLFSGKSHPFIYFFPKYLHTELISIDDFACEDLSAQFEQCIIIYSVSIYFFRWSKQLSYRIKCYLRKEVGRQSVTRSIVMGSELVSSVTGVLECHTVPLSLTRSTSHTQESSNVCPRILPASLSGSMSSKVTLTLPSLIHSKWFHCCYRNF